MHRLPIAQNDVVTMKKQLYLSMLVTALVACDSSDSVSVSSNADINNDGSETGINVDGSIGGETGESAENGDLLTLVGLIKMEPNSTEADFSRALFGQLDSGLSAEYIESFFAPTSDVCEVSRTSGLQPGFKIFDQETTLVSAGENLIVTSSGGTYATLNREIIAEGPTYQTDVRLTGSAPNGLTVDIPGEQFPTFQNVEITDVPALQMIGPVADQNVSASTEFTWVPNNVFRSVVEVYVGGVGANGETISIGCTVVDDGSFTFPESVRSEMGGDFDDDWSAYLRVVYNVVQADDAIVFTANSVENTQ